MAKQHAAKRGALPIASLPSIDIFSSRLLPRSSRSSTSLLLLRLPRLPIPLLQPHDHTNLTHLRIPHEERLHIFRLDYRADLHLCSLPSFTLAICCAHYQWKWL